jgi:hypothetical protein
MEHCPLASDRVRRRGRAVQPHAQPIQGSPDDPRVTELADRQRRAFQPGQRAGGGQVQEAEALLRVEGMTIQGAAQRAGRRPVSLASSGVTVASASAMLARECAARCGHFISAYAAACWYQVTVTGSGVAHAAGSPVAGLNSWPRRGARTSSTW